MPWLSRSRGPESVSEALNPRAGNRLNYREPCTLPAKVINIKKSSLEAVPGFPPASRDTKARGTERALGIRNGPRKRPDDERAAAQRNQV
jgi:hypothetical protein